MLCKTFMTEFKNWDLIASIFQWTIRSTAKVFNGSYSPYEVVTGLKPRLPTDMLANPSAFQRVSTEEYVSDLVTYLTRVHKYVDEQHQAVREQRQAAKHRELGPGTSLAVGDYCLVQKPLIPGVSKRLQPPRHDRVYQVVATHGDGSEAKAYTVSDLSGPRENLGFSQPVASERLTPVDILPLTQESEDRSTRIIVNNGGREREGYVQAQAVDGRVYVKWDDDPTVQCVDLTRTSYRWI